MRTNNIVIAIPLLLLAIGNFLLGFVFYSNTALNITWSVENSWHISIATLAYGLSFVSLSLALLYVLSTRLSMLTLGWLHSIGTVASVLIFWLAVMRIRDFGVLPGRYVDADRLEAVEQLLEQRRQLFYGQLAGAAFLFIVSQILLIINWWSRTKSSLSQQERKVLDQF